MFEVVLKGIVVVFKGKMGVVVFKDMIVVVLRGIAGEVVFKGMMGEVVLRGIAGVVVFKGMIGVVVLRGIAGVVVFKGMIGVVVLRGKAGVVVLLSGTVVLGGVAGVVVFKDTVELSDIVVVVLDGPIGKEMLMQGEQFWLRGLAFFDAGYRSFYTKDRPIHSPDDLSGLKIRVQESITAMNLVRNLGGAPTPISWGELYTALQQGVVDGAENNPPSFYTSRHYEVCKYYTLNEHTAVPDFLLIGTVAWNNLTSQEQEWLQQADDDAVVYQRKIWVESEEEALKAVQEAGVEIIRPDKTLFSEKTAAMLEEYKDDEVVYDLIQKIQAVQ